MEEEFALLSPEKTILTFRLAGMGSRVTAHLLDLLVVAGLVVAVVVGVSVTIGLLDPGLAQLIIGAATVLIPFGYFTVLEGLWNGQTLGKKATGIRVRMVDGTPVTFSAALGRNLIRPADMLPGSYFVGFVAMFTNAKSQRIGDLVAGTIVCHEKRPETNFSVAPHLDHFHPLEPFVGELAGMTKEEYVALRRFADRFPELPTHVQNKLTREVWEPVAERRKVPALANVHPIYLAEAVVMKYGRDHGLL